MGRMRLLRRVASSTSQSQIGERAEFGVSTRTTVSASLIRPPRLRFHSSPPEMPSRSMKHSKRLKSSAAVEVEVIAAVGDKDAKLFTVGRGRLFYLLGDTSRLRRSWTGCVMPLGLP